MDTSGHCLLIYLCFYCLINIKTITIIDKKNTRSGKHYYGHKTRESVSSVESAGFANILKLEKQKKFKKS